MIPPLTVQRKTLTESTDFDALAAEALAGNAALEMWPDDISPLASVFRFYDQIASSPYGDRFARGVANAITSANPTVRYNALLFFEKYPLAAGGERIDSIVSTPTPLFDGVLDPYTGGDLGFQLGRALSARVIAGHRGSLDLARALALREGGALGVIAALTSVDRAWTLANASAIVRRNPNTFGPILYQLALGDKEAAVALGEQVARLNVMPKQEFAAVVREHVADPAVQARILRALA